MPKKPVGLWPFQSHILRQHTLNKPPWVPGRQVASQEVHTTICKVDPPQPDVAMSVPKSGDLKWRHTRILVENDELIKHQNSGYPLFREKTYTVTSYNIL
jgi:hypothetical protein